jgi:hypothetical protein
MDYCCKINALELKYKIIEKEELESWIKRNSTKESAYYLGLKLPSI